MYYLTDEATTTTPAAGGGYITSTISPTGTTIQGFTANGQPATTLITIPRAVTTSTTKASVSLGATHAPSTPRVVAHAPASPKAPQEKAVGKILQFNVLSPQAS